MINESLYSIMYHIERYFNRPYCIENT